MFGTHRKRGPAPPSGPLQSDLFCEALFDPHPAFSSLRLGALSPSCCLPETLNPFCYENITTLCHVLWFFVLQLKSSQTDLKLPKISGSSLFFFVSVNHVVQVLAHSGQLIDASRED